MFVFEGRLHFGAADAKALLATICAGMVGNGIAYALWFPIIRRLPAMTASLGVLGVPVIGIICSVFILGEVPTATDIVGFALIFAASACRHAAHGRPAAEPAESLRLDARAPVRRCARSSRFGIGQRIDHGEMVGAGDLLVTRVGAAPAARLRRVSRLWRLNSLEFEPADDSVERTARRNRPEQRRHFARRGGVKLQILIDADAGEGVRSKTPEIE